MLGPGSFSPFVSVSTGVVVLQKDFVDNLIQTLEKNFPKSIRRVAENAKRFWIAEAGRRLHSTKSMYQAAIGTRNTALTHEIGFFNGSDRDKWMARALEYGISSYDLKPGFLKGQPFRDIPLTSGTKEIIRRVKSSPDHATKWVHPGFRGYNIREAVRHQIVTVYLPKLASELMKKT